MAFAIFGGRPHVCSIARFLLLRDESVLSPTLSLGFLIFLAFLGLMTYHTEAEVCTSFLLRKIIFLKFLYSINIFYLTPPFALRCLFCLLYSAYFILLLPSTRALTHSGVLNYIRRGAYLDPYGPYISPRRRAQYKFNYPGLYPATGCSSTTSRLLIYFVFSWLLSTVQIFDCSPIFCMFLYAFQLPCLLCLPAWPASFYVSFQFLFGVFSILYSA